MWPILFATCLSLGPVGHRANLIQEACLHVRLLGVVQDQTEAQKILCELQYGKYSQTSVGRVLRRGVGVLP
jgi:hypothetical protein